MTSVFQDGSDDPDPGLAADGTPRLPHVAYDDDGYPHSDGKRRSENTRQADQIYYAFPALETFVHERFPDAFVASDLLIYPWPEDLKASVAPGVFVAFGAGNHARLSYKLWEGEPVPAFVMDILAGSASDNALYEKRDRYVGMGIEEFWMFDPFAGRIREHVRGYRLQSGRYRPIPPLPKAPGYASAVLGLEFRAEGGNLRIHDPVAGEDLPTHLEAYIETLAAQRRADAAKRLADAEAKRADAAKRLADALARQNALVAENARLRRRLERYEPTQAS